MESTAINDLPLAAYLVVNDCRLINVKVDPRRTFRGTFLFEPSEKVADLTRQFYNDQGKCEPRSFLFALRELKGRVKEAGGWRSDYDGR